MRTRCFLIALTVLIAACQKNESTTATDTAAAPPAATKTSTAPQPVTINQGLQTPESVLWDAQQDVYFISNINGQPLAADNNGYISRVNPDTMQVDAKWVEGGKPGVTLDGPKGMAIVGDTLYVADITSVRKFDRKSGAPKGEIKIPGSTFLNDLASDGSSVYVSDSGLKAGAGGNFEPTGTDAIWKITKDKAQKIAGGDDLKRPNGVEIVGGKLWVVSFGGNELYQIDHGKKTNVATLPKGSLDGLVHLDDGSFLVSSWDGKAVYRGPAAGPFQTVLDNVNVPADIGYDSKRHRLLVPHFMDSIVTIHPLQ
jgi:sugar lactone lactonase YvrE